MEKQWKLYILRCADDTLYTGITVDITRRFRAHETGKGAKYTRGRGPLKLVYQELCGTHTKALQRELEIKALTRSEKELLIAAQLPNDDEIRSAAQVTDSTPSNTL